MKRTPRAAATSRADGVMMAPMGMRQSPAAGTSSAVITRLIGSDYCHENRIARGGWKITRRQNQNWRKNQPGTIYSGNYMALKTGTRLGPYEIIGTIGAGGMGEVYRAHDSRLQREVAIKTLPPAFADDTSRLARFQREAQALAALNHPNIASIYGLEESGGLTALVMELVDGATLAERIAAGPIPIAEALAIARQIGAALEAAHEKGIIHRDLKPANIKLTAEGQVKVLDFGLAKAFDVDSTSPSSALPANSPTLTLESTRAGVILGTAAYMSPEQARGKSVDRRADIWAFGVVLYEMVTGQKLFKGDDLSETLA
jgi:serine/threonine-protein kinase